MKRIRLSTHQLHDLDQLLKSNISPDPYAASAAYCALTGRNGLWIIEDDGTFAIECVHPNRTGEHLVLPAFGRAPERLMRTLLEDRPSLQLARVPLEAAQALSAGTVALEAIDEPVLDWAYPVHILDNEAVSKLAGSKFRNARKEVGYAIERGVSFRPLAPSDDEVALDLVTRWQETQDQDLSLSDYLSPYRRVFDLLALPQLRVRGIAACLKGEMVGFHLWERPPMGKDTANSLALCADRNIPGLSEYLIQETARRLASDGTPFMCLGGSETAGLDAYKRKFRPVRSVHLSTIITSSTARSATQAKAA